MAERSDQNTTINPAAWAEHGLASYRAWVASSPIIADISEVFSQGCMCVRSPRAAPPALAKEEEEKTASTPPKPDRAIDFGGESPTSSPTVDRSSLSPRRSRSLESAFESFLEHDEVAEAARVEATTEAARWVALVTHAEKDAPFMMSGLSDKLDMSAKDAEAKLQAWLRSGVVLCDLVNRVRSGSVDKATAGKPFHERSNIAGYLAACTSLGVPTQDLFETVDLYEAKDMRTVVRNLHSLGRVAQRIEGFEGPYAIAAASPCIMRPLP